MKLLTDALAVAKMNFTMPALVKINKLLDTCKDPRGFWSATTISDSLDLQLRAFDDEGAAVLQHKDAS